MLDGSVARDAREPLQRTAARAVELTALAPDAQVDLLEDFLGLIAVSLDAPNEVEELGASGCVRRSRSEPPCRSNSEPGRKLTFA